MCCVFIETVGFLLEVFSVERKVIRMKKSFRRDQVLLALPSQLTDNTTELFRVKKNDES